VHNGSVDRRRGALARCTDAAKLAREGEPPVSLRGGGHGWEQALGVRDDGLVIDRSSMGFGTNTSCYRDHFSCWLSGRGRHGGELMVDPTPKSGASCR